MPCSTLKGEVELHYLALSECGLAKVIIELKSLHLVLDSINSDLQNDNTTTHSVGRQTDYLCSQ